MTQIAMANGSACSNEPNGKIINREDIRFVSDDAFSCADAETRFFGFEAMYIEPRRWHFSLKPEDNVGGRVDYPPLTREEEIELFFRYNYARYRLWQLNESKGSAPSLDTIANVALWHERVLRVRSELVTANLPLVPVIAKRMRIMGVSFEDLLSEGYIAVLRSVDKFDVSRGFKFSTYACRSILSAFKRLAGKIACRYARFSFSFDPELEKPEKNWKTERVSESNIEVLLEALRRSTPGLSDIEYRIIVERFSLEAGAMGKTLAGVAKLVGLSPERVRQIEAGALKKIYGAIKDDVIMTRKISSCE